MMTMVAKQASKPSWADIKARLSDFDRAGLLGLVHDLYAANKDNQTFLHARFRLGDDVLKPYKDVIDRWLWPDPFKNQDISITKAKRAIADYKKAVGYPEGLAELMVFYCERAAGFCDDVGMNSESFFDALVRMFEQALKATIALDTEQKAEFFARLNKVIHVSHNFGYGVGDDMNTLFAKYTPDDS
jgi:hypothetical protein